MPYLDKEQTEQSAYGHSVGRSVGRTLQGRELLGPQDWDDQDQISRSCLHGAPESAFTALCLIHRERNPALTGDSTRD